MKYKFPEPYHYDAENYSFKLAHAYTDSYILLVEATVLIGLCIDAINEGETDFAVKKLSEFIDKMKAE